jgi:aspartate kinase
MELIVRKYGGSSLDTISKIKNIAEKTKKSINEGKKIVLVVSAMGKSTDELLNKAKMLSNNPNIRELDLLMSSGEIVSSSLMSIALQELGLNSISLTGFQAGIDTNSTFGEAQIVSIDNKRINNEINKGRVVVIAGFQGYNKNFEITTLGRGGSDTTAVALAASLKADICEVYTDVKGIFTADPRIVKNAKKIDYLSYEDMLELANYGAKMHPRSIELGLHYDMPIIIKSSFESGTGTIICNMEKLNNLQKRGIIVNKITENRNKVTGVTSEGNISKITLHNIPDKPGVAAKVFKPLSEAGINVDVIVQNISRNHKTDLTFTVNNEDFTHALNIVQNKSIKNINYENITSGSNYAKISIIGTGIQNSPGYAAKFFEALFESKVNIEMITTSDIRITCLINEKDINKAVNKVHDVFGLFE